LAGFEVTLIGRFWVTPEDVKGSQGFPFSPLAFFYPSKGNFIAVVGSIGEGLLVRRVKKAMLGASALPVYSINAPSFIPGVDFSDHLNYWNEGFPAVMITDTAFYRNHAYHTSGDTAERLDYSRMAMVVQGIYGAVLDLAQ
jgi:Zn-dependent M28 family amino/carboxypeptidase